MSYSFQVRELELPDGHGTLVADPPITFTINEVNLDDYDTAWSSMSEQIPVEITMFLDPDDQENQEVWEETIRSHLLSLYLMTEDMIILLAHSNETYHPKLAEAVHRLFRERPEGPSEEMARS